MLAGSERYRSVEYAGRGSMGAVYRAHDQSLARSVALKVLNDNLATHREARIRFENEAPQECLV